MRKDINACTSRQLTVLPGIDKRLSDNIVFYRQKHGGFKHFDELWKVSGMTRSKMKLLKRHWCVPGQKPLVAGGVLPYAKLSLDESMMDFVCRGKSLPSQDADPEEAEPEYRRRSARPRDSAKRRDARQSRALERKPRPDKNDASISPTRQNSKVNVPSGENLEAECSGIRQVVCSKELSKSKADKKPVEEEKYLEDLELLQSFAPHRVRQAWDESGGGGGVSGSKAKPQPTVTIETSASDNNVKFSCTIDKRLLRHQTSMALQLDELMMGQNADNNGEKQREKPNGKPAAEPLSSPMTQPHDQRYLVKDVIFPPNTPRSPDDKPGDSKSNDKESCSGGKSEEKAREKADVPRQQAPAELPSLDQKDQAAPLVTQPKADHFQTVAHLTRENILLHERRNRVSDDEKRQIIECWVSDVNDARDVGRLLKGRECVSPGKDFSGQVRFGTTMRIVDCPQSKSPTKGSRADGSPTVSMVRNPTRNPSASSRPRVQTTSAHVIKTYESVRRKVTDRQSSPNIPGPSIRTEDTRDRRYRYWGQEAPGAGANVPADKRNAHLTSRYQNCKVEYDYRKSARTNRKPDRVPWRAMERARGGRHSRKDASHPYKHARVSRGRRPLGTGKHSAPGKDDSSDGGICRIM